MERYADDKGRKRTESASGAMSMELIERVVWNYARNKQYNERKRN